MTDLNPYIRWLYPLFLYSPERQNLSPFSETQILIAISDPKVTENPRDSIKHIEIIVDSFCYLSVIFGFWNQETLNKFDFLCIDWRVQKGKKTTPWIGSKMSHCLILKPACMGCGSRSDLYGSSCRHMTLCLKCGKTMAENKAKCLDCGTVLTRLIRVFDSFSFIIALRERWRQKKNQMGVFLFCRSITSVRLHPRTRTTSLVGLPLVFPI